MDNQNTTWSPRTDLALEIGMQLKTDPNHEQGIEGVSIETMEHETYDITTTYVHIENEKGEEAMGKPIGHYITIEAPAMKENDPDAHKCIVEILAKELQALLPKKDKPHVMVVGLGNRLATPDRLGPDVSGKVLVTRHIHQQVPEAIDDSVGELSSLTPGVMGLTGIETSEIIRGVASQTKPDCIIAVDALAARNIKRINATIQLTNTGISPGAGVGNKRKELSEATMGCPVIAVGVPTVIDTATLVNDTMEQLIEGMLQNAPDDTFYNMLKEVGKHEKYEMFKEILQPQMGNLFVTAKDIDEIIDYLGRIIFNSINIAVHPGMDSEDINKYVY